MLDEVKALREKYTATELGQLAELLQEGRVSSLEADIENLEALMQTVKDEYSYYRAWIQHARNNPTMSLTALLAGLDSARFPLTGQPNN
jgi:hypothetical protein